ncbi:hypothetical protein GCM10027514_11100 [Azotobacter armeniacus]
MVVIAVEEAALLIAMHRHIGRIEIEHDLGGCLVMLSDEVLPQQAMGLHHRFAIGLLFQTPRVDLPASGCGRLTAVCSA